MNIALVGYRGSGKSTVARLAGEMLRWPVVSTDALIVARTGPIPKIVSQRGWDYFRQLEEAALSEVCAADRQIIDCGGGVVLREANRRVLKQSSFIIWLAVSAETAVNRIKEDDQRPSLTGAKSFTDEVAEVLSQRTPLYASACDLKIDTDLMAPISVAQQVVEAFQNKCPGGSRER